MPNVNELESLLHADQANTAAWLNTQGFNSVQAYWYWSSTTYAASTDYYAWFVFMYVGNVYYDGKTNSYYVWPVRAGQ